MIENCQQIKWDDINEDLVCRIEWITKMNHVCTLQTVRMDGAREMVDDSTTDLARCKQHVPLEVGTSTCRLVAILFVLLEAPF